MGVIVNTKTQKTPADDDLPPLDKRELEPERRHRALLLYAMMEERSRSCRYLGKVVGKGDKTMRNWKKWHDWDERMARCGPGVQSIAIRTFWELYPEFVRGVSAMMEVKMSVPLNPAYLPEEMRKSTETAFGGGEARQKLKEDMAEAGRNQAVGRTKQVEKQNDAMNYLDRARVTLDLAIVQAARGLREGKQKVAARDLPAILRARHEVDALLQGDTAVSGQGGVPKSPRVIDAERQGTSVHDAMLKDMEDARAVLVQLKTQAELAAKHAADRESLAESGTGQLPEGSDAGDLPEADAETANAG